MKKAALKAAFFIAWPVLYASLAASSSLMSKFE